MPGTRKKKIETPKSTAQQLGGLIKSCRDIMRKDKGLNGDIDRLPMLTWIMFLKFLDDLEDVRKEEAELAGKRFRPAIESPYRWRDWASKSDGITGTELIAFVNQDEAIRPDGTRGAGLFAYLRSLQSTNGDRRDVIARVFQGTVNRMINGYLLRDVINKVNDIHFTSKDEIHTLGLLYESLLRQMRDAAGDSGEFYTPRAVVEFIVAAIDPQLGETLLDPAAGTGGFLVEAFEHLKRQSKRSDDYKKLQRGTLFGIEPKPLPYLLCQMNLLLHGLEYPDIDSHNALRFPLREIGDKDRVDIIVTNPPFGGEEERGILSNFPEDKQTSETALLFLQLIMRKLRKHPAGRAGVVVPESTMGDSGVAQRVRQELIENYNLKAVVRMPKGVFEPYSDIQTNLLFFDASPKGDGVWFYQHEVPTDRQLMRNPCYTKTMPLRFEELQTLLEWWKEKKATERAWYVGIDDIRKANYSLDFRNPKRSGTGKDADNVTAGLDALVRSASEQLTVLRPHLERLKQMQGAGSEYLVSNFLKLDRMECAVQDDQHYKQITVKLYGKGVVERTTLPGRDIRTRPQFIARKGQLIMSRIDARNGAFGIIPDSLDGALVTNDFPCFDIDSDIIEPDFLALMLTSTAFLDVCKRASRGTTNRKRLREELFLSERMFVPSPDVQEETILIGKLANGIESQIAEAGKMSDGLRAALADAVLRRV